MAKTVNCVFCGKEMTRGMFSGDAASLELSKHTLVDCCDECRAKYEKEAKRIRKRFTIKVENWQKSTRKKMDHQTMAQNFLLYLQQEQEQLARCGRIETAESAGYFLWDGKQHFAVRETELDFDVLYHEFKKTDKHYEDVEPVWFSKEDITCLQYRTQKVGRSMGLFTSAYSFEVRLNDEKEFSFKPAITKMSFAGTGLFPHTQRKKAKAMCEAALVALAIAIGSDISVEYVKKFN